MAEFILGGLLVAVLWLAFSSLIKKASRIETLERPAGDLDEMKAISESEGVSLPVAPPPPTVVDHEPEIIILAEYERVLDEIRKGTPATFVTGKAGTGKSTMIGFLLENLQNVAVVAPTGIAALNVGGVTIHSFFRFPPEILDPEKAYTVSKKMVPVFQNLNVLIVDEVSMVKPDMIDCMSNGLQVVRENELPFGGVPVVFVGDLHQLPPVVKGNAAGHFYSHRYPNPFFFSADMFLKETVSMEVVELTRVFRQEDSEFVEMLDRVRRGDGHRDAVARFNRECNRDRLPPETPSLFLVATNAAAWCVNLERLKILPSPARCYEACSEGRFNTKDDDRLPAPEKLNLKVGAQVLFVKNNRPFWVNGSLGEVVELGDTMIRVRLAGSASVVDVQRVTWENKESVYDQELMRVISKVVGTYTQFPLALGWAITIHKSQGMTLDSVRIDISTGAFAPGQTYVALSRSRTLAGIYLDEPFRMKDVIVDERVVEFYRRMRAGNEMED